MNLRDTDMAREELFDVSIPTRAKYGQHLTLDQIKGKYSPTEKDVAEVVAHFQQMSGAVVEANKLGNFIQVTAPVGAIERHLRTKLGLFKHGPGLTEKRALRAVTDMTIPDHIAEKISFISLNVPVTHAKPRSARSRKTLKASHLKDKSHPDAESAKKMSHAPHKLHDIDLNTLKKKIEEKEKRKQSRVINYEAVYAALLKEETDSVHVQKFTKDASFGVQEKIGRKDGSSDWEGDALGSTDPNRRHVIVTVGNDEAILRFAPTCPDGKINGMNPPCAYAGLKPDEVPEFTAYVAKYANFRNNMYKVSANPLIFPLQPKDIFCYNKYSAHLCSGNDGANCTCFTKVSRSFCFEFLI
jgi:hypothetical protein